MTEINDNRPRIKYFLEKCKRIIGRHTENYNTELSSSLQKMSGDFKYLQMVSASIFNYLWQMALPYGLVLVCQEQRLDIDSEARAVPYFAAVFIVRLRVFFASVSAIQKHCMKTYWNNSSLLVLCPVLIYHHKSYCSETRLFISCMKTPECNSIHSSS